MKFLDIDYSLQIGISDSGIWKIKGGNYTYDLSEPSDFWRAYVLLEKPYTEVKVRIDQYSSDVKAITIFPYWKVVSAGLASEIDSWASLALSWFPYLNSNEKKMLNEHLRKIVVSKNWASQKTRQQARYYIKQQNEQLGESKYLTKF